MRARGYVLWKRAYPNDVYIRKDMITSRLKRLWFGAYGAIVFSRNWMRQDRDAK
jgi:hypothetical protein